MIVGIDVRGLVEADVDRRKKRGIGRKKRACCELCRRVTANVGRDWRFRVRRAFDATADTCRLQSTTKHQTEKKSSIVNSSRKRPKIH